MSLQESLGCVVVWFHDEWQHQHISIPDVFWSILRPPPNSDFFQQIFPVGGSILQEAMQSLGLLVLR